MKVKMKKVAIMTLNGYYNYGNRLQNYALQKVIESLGFECETILNTTCKKNRMNDRIKRFINLSFSDKYLLISKKFNSNKHNKQKIHELDESRMELFKEFSNKNINETNFSIELGKVPHDLERNYEYIVAGSDQVWNPNYDIVSELNFLTFAPKQKRVSYAASFGVSTIPDKYKKSYTRWLEDMNFISVREEAGAKIVKKLTGRDAQVLVDPTMLLTKEEWMNVSNQSIAKSDKKYLLTYFLGGIPKEYKSTIDTISNKYNLDIVNLCDIEYPEHYVTGPSEFIDYINSASVFFTDSFHGCVFSLLLETPFVVCNRAGQTSETSMHSRIDTFIKKFKLESRLFSNLNENNLFENDYSESNKLLDQERKKSWRYLKESLNIK